MATNCFNLVSLLFLFSALLLIPFEATTLAQALSSSVPTAGEVPPHGSVKIMPPAFPERWGPPPLAMTRDYVPLPGGYGRRSGVLRKWITKKMEEDVASGIVGGADDGAPPASSSSATRITAEDDGKLWRNKDLVGWTGEDCRGFTFFVLLGYKGVRIVPKDLPPTCKKVTWNNSTSPVSRILIRSISFESQSLQNNRDLRLII